jgi:phage repressor protein C with HTH and peptisase S24 domain
MAKTAATFPARLADLIESRAGGVVRRFAQAIGVNHQAVHNWLDGARQPGAKALTAIWRVYRVDPLWLLTGEAGVQGPVVLRVAAPARGRAKPDLGRFAAELEDERFVALPLAAAGAAGASPRDLRPQDIADYVVARADWLPHPETVTCVRVVDDAMAPRLPRGAIVAIDHAERDAQKLDGRLVAMRHGGAVAIRICRLAEPGLVIGLTENAAAPAMVFPAAATRDGIVGAVVGWWATA